MARTISEEGAQADTLPQDTVKCTNGRPALLLDNVIAVILGKLEYGLQVRAAVLRQLFLETS